MSKIAYRICGGCGFGYSLDLTDHSCSISKSYKSSAQLRPSDRPVVWEHPVTKEVRYPGHNGDMPKYYKDLGYERVEFPSYHEHKKWCDEHGVVNHAVEGIRDEALES